MRSSRYIYYEMIVKITMETIGSSLPQHCVCALSGTEEVWNHTGATGNPFPWQLQGDQQDGT